MKRRKWRRLWRPMLRPRAGRTLQPELRVQNVGRLAAALPDGLRDPGFSILLRRIDESPILDGNRVTAFFQRPADVRGDARGDRQRPADGASRVLHLQGRRDRPLPSRSARRAVDRGVAVRVLADAFGSIATRRGFWKEMRERGIEVRLFNPLFPQLFLQPFRDHRKILVIDDETGVHRRDEHRRRVRVSSLSAHGGPWRDTHVQVDGPAAWAMAIVFTEAWNAAGGSPIELDRLEPRTGPVSVMVLDSRPFRGTGEIASALRRDRRGGAKPDLDHERVLRAAAPRGRGARPRRGARRGRADPLPGKSDVADRPARRPRALRRRCSGAASASSSTSPRCCTPRPPWPTTFSP